MFHIYVINTVIHRHFLNYETQEQIFFFSSLQHYKLWFKAQIIICGVFSSCGSIYLFLNYLISNICVGSLQKAMTIAALHCINAPDNCPRHDGSYQGIDELQWFTQRSWSDSSALSLYQKFRWRNQKVWSIGTKVL